MRLKAILTRSSTRTTRVLKRNKTNASKPPASHTLAEGSDSKHGNAVQYSKGSTADCDMPTTAPSTASQTQQKELWNFTKRISKNRCHRDRGDLVFSDCFESGNIGRVIRSTGTRCEYDYDISIRPDSNNSKYRVWFNFTVSNTKKNQRVVFHINNYSKPKTLFRDGLSPVVKASYESVWQRLPSDQVFYYRCPHHARKYCISFTFMFERTDAYYSFAYSFPYTYTYLQRFLKRVDNQDFAFYKREILCGSVQHRRLDLVTITDPINLIEASASCKSRVVAITARVHPGESPASIVAHGIIQFLCSSHPNAKLLRKHLVFCIIPMLNPDGVCLGNYRCSSSGVDLNRCWKDPEWWNQPTIRLTKDFFLKLAGEPFVSLDVIIDIHAHTNARSCFMFVNRGEGTNQQKGVEMAFPRLLHRRFPQFDLSQTRFEGSNSKQGTSRRTLGDFLPRTRCYTLEVSYLGHCPEDGSPPTFYNPPMYKDLGKVVVETFLDYYDIVDSTKGSNSIVKEDDWMMEDNGNEF